MSEVDSLTVISPPPFLFGQAYLFIRNNQGLPGSLALLFLPATPLRHRQTLQVLAPNEPFVLASVERITSPSASLIITMLYHASGEHLSPCGLYDSLCTLRVGRSTVCLSFPITQHSVRVVGYSLPDRDSHPARNTRLGPAHAPFFIFLGIIKFDAR